MGCWRSIIVGGKMLGRTGDRDIDIGGLEVFGEDFGAVELLAEIGETLKEV